MHATTGPRRLAGVLLLAGALVLPAHAALAAPVGAAAPGTGPCADASGVTVVVDATELGGDVAVGCAPDPATGTQALTQAGFTEARDPSGFICAVAGLPDPCPTEFTGSYWSYWSADASGEWTTYMEGSDTATPAPGSVEGWRYGDGTQPPAVDVADVLPGAAGDAPAATEGSSAEAAPDAEPSLEATAADDGTAEPEDADGSTTDLPGWVGVAVGVAILGGLVGLVVRLRRQSADRQD